MKTYSLSYSAMQRERIAAAQRQLISMVILGLFVAFVGAVGTIVALLS